MDLLDHGSQQVDYSFMFVAADVGRVFRMTGDIPYDQEDAVADTSGFDSELSFFLDFHVSFVDEYTIFEDFHAVVNDHILNGFLVDSWNIGFDQCYFIAIYLFDFDVVIGWSLPWGVQVDLGELDHEVIGNYFADDEFVLAVDEKEGVEVYDAGYLRCVCFIAIVNLFEEFVGCHFWVLQGVVYFELILGWLSKYIV